MLIRRLFHHMRFGQSIVFPILSMSNFVLIIYNFTDLKLTIPLEWFAIGCFAGLVLLLVVIGTFMHRKQRPVDIKLEYERNKPFAGLVVVMLKTMQRSFLKNDEDYKALQKQIDYHEEIANR